MDKTLVMNIRAIIEALNEVEVKGKHNMEALLGSIHHLEKIINGEFGEFVLKTDSGE